MFIDFLDRLHHKQKPIDVFIDVLDLLHHKQEPIDLLIDFMTFYIINRSP